MFANFENLTDHSNDSFNSSDSATAMVVSTDRCLEMQAAVRLHDDPHLKGHSGSIQCCYRNRSLSLAGQLPSFFLKQRAQEVLRSLEGVDKIDNRIVVGGTVGQFEASIPHPKSNLKRQRSKDLRLDDEHLSVSPHFPR